MEDETKRKTLAGIALDGSAFLGSLMAGVTGDYASLGGYEGIRKRLEIGLYELAHR